MGSQMNGADQQSQDKDPRELGMRAEGYMLVVGKVVAYATYAYVVFIDVLLVFRVLLIALGANPHAGFARFVYRTTADALAPFRGLFPPHSAGETGYVDVSALFAIVVYLLIGFFVGQLIDFLNYKVRIVRRPPGI